MSEAVHSSASKQASKQAVLIIAHETNSVFTSILKMLDHPKIDIFIHMDAKNKSYDPAETLKLVKYSRVIHTRRIKVAWGAFSQIEAELILLEAATSEGHYGHYHLISGADLPIKKAEDIIAFFEEHPDTEFVDFQKKPLPEETQNRTKYYFFFQDFIGKPSHKNNIARLLAKVRNRLLRLQKRMHICRNKGIDFHKGSQWFSITDKFARYALSQREWIRKTFHHTHACDEIFLHTILMASEFRYNVFGESSRLIDWNRRTHNGASPHTFTIDDLDMITSSSAMFARKFHPSVDQQIIDKIFQLYS